MNGPVRYRDLKRTFHDGGMSTASVYRDEHLDRDVVIKKLVVGADQRRLLDEVRALSTIRSKHVVELYDVIRDSHGNITQIVEEFIPGDDLDSKAGKVNLEEALRYGFAIASGISDIHRHGQIHRDIKLKNMKFDAEGCIKIFDFGLARKSDDAATIGLVGTFGYLAPELCVPSGAEARFSPAVDVFAFASAMLKIVRGKIPSRLKKVPPDLPCPESDFRTQNINLPNEISDLLNLCHAVRAVDRPPIELVRDTIARHLVFNQHRATLVVSGVVHALDSANTVVNISAGFMGKFTVAYDGLVFRITATEGSIFINNIPVTVPTVLPGSCVITMGPTSAGMSRVYVPIDVSQPEVIL